MRYAQTLSVYIIYSNKAVYYPSYAGIIRIRFMGMISAAAKTAAPLRKQPLLSGCKGIKEK